MNKTIERVARAIYEALGYAEDDEWDAAILRRESFGMTPAFSAHQLAAIKAARFAVLALSEAVSDEMVEAAWRGYDNPDYETQSPMKAAIQAALKAAGE